MNPSFPKLNYSTTSEIPKALGSLSEEELASVLEARLGGETAGLPIPHQEESPADILLYAFQNGDDKLRKKFQSSLNAVLERQFRALTVPENATLNGHQVLLDNLFFLAGMTDSREVLPTIRRFLPFIELTYTTLAQRLVACIASLATGEDTALVPWLVEKVSDSAQSRIAFKALYRIHPPTAAAALPKVAVSLQRQGGDVSSLLARTLALVMPILSEAEQLEFIGYVRSALEITPESTVVVAHALNLTPGVSSKAARSARMWSFKPLRETPQSLPKERDRQTLPEAHASFAHRPTRTASEKKQLAIAHVQRVEKLLERLKRERQNPAPITRQIEQQITYLTEFQGKSQREGEYFAQTLTQLASRLIESRLFEVARSAIKKARSAAPLDPYPINTEIHLSAAEGNLAEAASIFAEAKQAGLATEVTYNVLLDAYGKAGDVTKAEEIFIEAKEADLANEVTYSALLDAYGKAGDILKAEQLFTEAKRTGLATEFTYNALLDAYGKAGNVVRAEAVFAEAKEEGLATDVTYNALLDTYSKARETEKARRLFDQAKEAGLANEFTYSTLIAAYDKAGELTRAEEVFAEAKKAGLASEFAYNALLHAYGKAGDITKTEEVFAEANKAGLIDRFTYNTLLDSYGKAGDIAKAEEIFAEVKQKSLVDATTYTTLLDAYGKTGNIAKAEEVFAEAEKAGMTNEITYNALLDAYGKVGDLAKAQEVFARAQKTALVDASTYATLLHAYGKTGDIARAREIFVEAKKAGLVNEFTYNAMLGAYGKAKDIQNAEEILAETELAGLANEVTYSTLLAAYARTRKVQKLINLFNASLRSDSGLSQYDRRVIAFTLLQGLHSAAREDEIFDLAPPQFIDEEVLIYYAKLSHKPSQALVHLNRSAEDSNAAQFVCRYRAAVHERRADALESISTQIEYAFRGAQRLSQFSSLQLTETLSRCYRVLERWDDMHQLWSFVNPGTLSRGPRIAFLAGHGRDSITWALQGNQPMSVEQEALILGTEEVVDALALEQTSDTRNPEIFVAFGSVISAFKEVRQAFHSLKEPGRLTVLSSLSSRRSALEWGHRTDEIIEIPPDEVGEFEEGREALADLLKMAA